MDQFMQATAIGLSGGLANLALTVVWIVAIGLGVMEYSRSKGRLGRALMVTIGGGILATFVIYPDVITSTVPKIFKSVLDYVQKVAGA